ncbi:hypothetical protein LAD67_05795 [Escherichia coli]|nr:hypothetical protein [Escherichia coli]
MLNALDCQRHAAGFTCKPACLPKKLTRQLSQKACHVFPTVCPVSRNAGRSGGAERLLKSVVCPSFTGAASTYNKLAQQSHCLMATLRKMSPFSFASWRGLAIHAWNKQHDYELRALS